VRRLLIASLLVFGCKDDAPAPASDAAKTPPPKADAKAEAKATDAKTPPDAEPDRPEPKLVEPLGTPGGTDEPIIQVQLPPSPGFPTGAAPDKYPDGVWSIAGLRRDLDAQVKAGDAGTEIEVRGWVLEIYVPPECPEGEVCPPPKQPHLFIVDAEADKGKRNAMMVVNYAFTIPEWDARRWKGQPDVVVEVGKQYTFKGKLRQFSDTGFAHDRGLLEFVAYRPHDPDTGLELADWVYPPGAPWHPMEIARQEEENAALAERAARAAGR